jgi:hypothetical protein
MDLKRSLYRIIEETDWDNELIRQAERIDGVCWAVIALAAVFFGLVLIQIVLR